MIATMDTLQTLEHAVKVAGNARKLAAELGASPVTISVWRKRGAVPAPWAELLRIKYAKRKAKVKP